MITKVDQIPESILRRDDLVHATMRKSDSVGCILRAYDGVTSLLRDIRVSIENLFFTADRTLDTWTADSTTAFTADKG